MTEEPQLFSHEAERALLGLLMTASSIESPGAARLLLEREQLSPVDFHLTAHGVVYRAVQGLLAVNTPADPVSVFERTRGETSLEASGGLGWLFEVHRSADALISQSFPGFAQNVREFAVRRRLVSELRSSLALVQSHGVDLAQALQSVTQRIAAVTFRRDSFSTLTEVMDQIEGEIHKGNDAVGTRLIPSGIDELDRLIGGLAPLLLVIAGRPGAGKSAVAATLTETLARNGHKVGVFSLEDRAPWLGYRLLSANASVPNHALRYRKLDGPEWERTGAGLQVVRGYADKVLVDDRRRMTAPDIVQSARNMIVNHGCRALLIDHLLEVKPREKFARRDLEIADALGQFRDVANEYELPVIVFTQLNRGAEGKKEPTMSDFKDAGSVEEMARVAIALVRDGDTIGMCVIKNTNGVLGRVDVEFLGEAAMVATSRRQKAMF